jgi:hypothetical protein
MKKMIDTLSGSGGMETLSGQDRKRRKTYLALFLGFMFLFRLAFGLCGGFWFDDQLQVYLLGLKYATTGLWPYFGPDIVYTHSQIPGALQALLVGLPLKLIPIPEAPFILLNILSFTALVLLASYITRLFPSIPAWFVWGWTMTAPWALDFSTYIINPSYILFGAVIFFIGFLETSPWGLKRIPAWLCGLMMGFAVFWIFQVHMSWVLLVPFVALSGIFILKNDTKKTPGFITGLVIGCLLTGSLLIPTFIRYGLHNGTGGTGANIRFNSSNIPQFFTVLARYLSLASWESTRFIGPDTPQRIAFLKHYFWVIPFFGFAAIAGVVQPLYMIIRGFFKWQTDRENWLRNLNAGFIILIWISFFFSIKSPSSHTYYLAFPLVLFYFFAVFGELIRKKVWKIVTIVLLISGFISHMAIMHHELRTNSLYKDRSRVVRAIMEKNYHIVGERRKTDNGIGY